MFNQIKKLLKHGSIYGSGNILNKLVGFVLIPVYTRCLSPTDYGILELVVIIPAFIGLFIEMGIGSAIFRFYYSYEDAKEKNKVISTAFVFITLASSLVILSVFPFSEKLMHQVAGVKNCGNYLELALITFFLSTISIVFDNYLLAEKRSLVYISISVLDLILNLSFNIYFVVIKKAGVFGVLYSGLITRTVIFTLLFMLVIPRVKLNFSRKHLKEILGYGLPLIPAQAAIVIMTSASRIFISRFISLNDVGIYSLGFRFAYMLNFLLIQPFLKIWQPQMFEIVKLPDAKLIYSRVFTYLFLILAVAGLVISFSTKELLQIIASKAFANSYLVVPLLTASFIFRACYSFFQIGILLDRKTKYISYVTIVGALINLILNYLLIPRWGIMGAALTMLLTYCVMSLGIYFYSQLLYKVHYEFNRLLKISAVAFIFFVSSVIFIKIENPYLSLTTKLILTFLFPFTLYILGFYNSDEKVKLSQLGAKTKTYVKYCLSKN